MSLKRRTIVAFALLISAPVAQGAPAGPPVATGPAAQPVPAADIPPMALKVKNFDRSLLAPVDGVTLRQVGQASYLQFLDPDAKTSGVLERLHLTKERFEAADKVFTERMKQDRTDTITALFGAYFNEAAEGFYAPLGRDAAISVLDDVPLKEKEPMPEEKFREIQAYYGRKASVAGTALDKQDDILKPYGLSFNDFNIIGAWFGRRLALQSGDRPGDHDRGPPDPARDNPSQHPEWGGLYRFTWSLLKRGETGMVASHETRDICLKSGMDAKTLPVMPKPDGAKCVLIGSVDFYESGVGLRAQCDHGAYGTSWGLELSEPLVKGKSYKGEIMFNMQNEHLTDLPQPQTIVHAERIGDCP